MTGPFDRGETTTRVEAFVDAAFAFALTLLAIAGDHIPSSIDELVAAMKGMPAYAMSFLLVVRVWSSHVEWSRYGLDDTASRRLSLLLVFLVLVFVHPLKMVFGALFSALSDGWLPANFALAGIGELPSLFITFGIAFGSLGAVMSLLYLHAWRSRDAIGLGAGEAAMARMRTIAWALLPVVALVSIATALLVPARRESGRWLGLPGFVYFLLNVATPLLLRRARAAPGGGR